MFRVFRRSKPTLAKPTLGKPTLAKVKVKVVCKDFGFWGVNCLVFLFNFFFVCIERVGPHGPKKWGSRRVGAEGWGPEGWEA